MKSKTEAIDDRNYVYLCECGSWKHRSDSIYCSMCGKKIDRNRKSGLADQIEDLLVRWQKETNGISISRLSAYPLS